jgi:hypothetical protein
MSQYIPPRGSSVKAPELDYLERWAGSVLPGGDLDFALLVAMRGERDGDGPLDHPCPLCGPERSTEERQLRPVLRTWRPSPDRISYYCARCEAKGVACAGDPPRLSPLPRWLPPPSRPRAASGANDLRAKELWEQATTELPATVVAYFKWRGIPLEGMPEGALRYHPECPFSIGDGKAALRTPCILARYTDALTGQARGIWRRPPHKEITPKSLGSMRGCVIRLWPTVGKRLILGEGIETTLAAATCATYRGARLQPAWAAGCAGNMRSFPVLDGIEQLILLVDNDETGREAAEACAKRWYEAGRCVIRLTPPEPGTDFNDWVQS